MEKVGTIRSIFTLNVPLKSSSENEHVLMSLVEKAVLQKQGPMLHFPQLSAAIDLRLY